MTKMSQFDTVQSMTDEEVERGFVQWQAAAREYQDRFGPRVQAILGRIKTMTGKPVEVILLKSDLVADSRTFKVKEVATDITNLAGTLP
jgi:hypothetical protein